MSVLVYGSYVASLYQDRSMVDERKLASKQMATIRHASNWWLIRYVAELQLVSRHLEVGDLAGGKVAAVETLLAAPDLWDILLSRHTPS